MSPRAHRSDLPELPPQDQMTVEEFLAYTGSRPDEVTLREPSLKDIFVGLIGDSIGARVESRR